MGLLSSSLVGAGTWALRPNPNGGKMNTVPYLVMKVLHVLAVTLFLGNLIVGILWKVHGDSTRDPKIIAHTLRGIMLADRWFTMPSVILLLLTGFGAQGIGRYPISTPWILGGIVLFALSGFVFMTRVAPVQRQLLAIAQAGGSGEMDWAAYGRLTAQWNLWGTIATALPVIALVLMVWKPV
jgi:uncharacterized membrane protein